MLKSLLKLLFGAVVLGAGVGAALYFLKTKPTVQRVRPEPKPAQVEVFEAVPSSVTVKVKAMGTVVPAREIVLRSRVSGTVISLSRKFLPGGLVDEDSELLRIDPDDFEIEVKKKKSALARALADLKLEQGRQEVARQEYRLLQEGSARELEKSELALRRPQLEQARADVAGARADLEMARLDLARTRIKAPFPALIRERKVNVGSLVSSQDALATLVDSRKYWVEAQVALGDLRLLRLGGSIGPSPAVVHSQSTNETWPAQVLQLTGSVDETTRMATLILEVPEPLAGNRELLLGDYVRVVIQGRELQNMIKLPLQALHQDNTVWLFDQGRLRTVSIRPVWKSEDAVYTDQGLDAGDLIITSQLSMPAPDMRLSIHQSEEEGE